MYGRIESGWAASPRDAQHGRGDESYIGARQHVIAANEGTVAQVVPLDVALAVGEVGPRGRHQDAPCRVRWVRRQARREVAQRRVGRE